MYIEPQKIDVEGTQKDPSSDENVTEDTLMEPQHPCNKDSEDIPEIQLEEQEENGVRRSGRQRSQPNRLNVESWNGQSYEASALYGWNQLEYLRPHAVQSSEETLSITE